MSHSCGYGSAEESRSSEFYPEIEIETTSILAPPPTPWKAMQNLDLVEQIPAWGKLSDLPCAPHSIQNPLMPFAVFHDYDSSWNTIDDDPDFRVYLDILISIEIKCGNLSVGQGARNYQCPLTMPQGTRIS